METTANSRGLRCETQEEESRMELLANRLLMTEEPNDGAARRLKSRYFVDSPGTHLREWFPPQWDESLPLDCRYFGKTLAEMDRQLPEDSLQPPLHVYLTYDPHALPEYGDRVVALLLSDEVGLIPRYARHVRAVFKTHRMRPVLGSSTLWKVDRLNVALWLKFVRNCALHFLSRWNSTFVPSKWPPRIHDKAQVFDVPLGYWRQDLLPQKSMEERTVQCFFAGSVSLKMPFWRRPIPSPKEIARRNMFATVEKMKLNNGAIRFDVGEVTASTLLASADSLCYSKRMMDARICLAPRGTAIDTWRLFEGLRAGCLVICEHLSDDWFYAGAPVLRIDDWTELQRVIEPYLDNLAALEEARLRSLAWWRDVCSEVAVGRAMADYLLKMNVK